MNRELRLLRERPVPDLDLARSLKGEYRSRPISADNSCFAEPLVPLSDFGIPNRSMHHDPLNPPYFGTVDTAPLTLMVRQSVAAKLRRSNDRLLHLGYELIVVDAFRPLALQQVYVHKIVPSLTRELHLEKDEVTANLWADPDNLDGPPPHVTGAAVDVTLRKESSKEHLFMGSILDEPHAISWPDYFEKNQQRERFGVFSMREATANRRVLYWTLTAEGLQVNPTEWWHYSWGDQLWAATTGGIAVYGAATEPGSSRD